mmetsp:Transcript_27558/g.87240  ORF Transcript_27558/g.87240 Transcript_27558/m.87240 type:complete len:229 (+) Transcript_27558:158-844(+)
MLEPDRARARFTSIMDPNSTMASPGLSEKTTSRIVRSLKNMRISSHCASYGTPWTRTHGNCCPSTSSNGSRVASAISPAGPDPSPSDASSGPGVPMSPMPGVNTGANCIGAASAFSPFIGSPLSPSPRPLTLPMPTPATNGSGVGVGSAAYGARGGELGATTGAGLALGGGAKPEFEFGFAFCDPVGLGFAGAAAPGPFSFSPAMRAAAYPPFADMLLVLANRWAPTK